MNAVTLHIKQRLHSAAWLFGSALLSACATQVSTPPAAMVAPVALAPLNENWWRLYDDATLDAWVHQSLEAGPEPRIAAANLRKARSLWDESRAARYPSSDVSLGISVDESTPDPDGSTDTFSGGLGLSYEFDFAGRRRQNIDAAQADAIAAQASFDAMRVSIAAGTAQAYTDACVAGLQLDVARRSLDLQQRTAALVEKRVAAGEVAGLDAALAHGQLAQTRATLPTLEADRSAALLRLAALAGKTPADAGLDTFDCHQPPALRVPIPSGDGVALITRRPDLRESEQRVKAALARVGVAEADLYPRVRIGAQIGAGGETASDIGFKWALTPLLSWQLPNRLAVRARITQAEADRDAALAQWDRSVLLALRDVETALIRYARELDRNADLQQARAHYADAARRAESRYRLGSEAFLAVLDAQRRLTDADAQLAISQGRLSTGQVSLFVALGGGWAP